MKFAAIADIHGNSAALEAVLGDIDDLGIDHIVNLGDHVSGPMDAKGTADLLMSRHLPSIQGDQDRLLVEFYARGPDASKRVDFQTLEHRHFEWLANQPGTMTYGGAAFLCHGSPRSDTAYWLDHVGDDGRLHPTDIDLIEAQAEGIAEPLILCAHTHIARVVRLRDGRVVVNPGSVGLPGYIGREPVEHVVETGTPDACYAILESNAGMWQATLRYVPYDSRPMAALARARNMTAWAQALETGWIERKDAP